MEIPPMITILLVGLSASGKSSLINYMYSVLGRSGLIPFAQTSSMFTHYPLLYSTTFFLAKGLREFTNFWSVENVQLDTFC